jgi:enoyl-CoA hydratase
MIHHEERGTTTLITIDRPERRNALDAEALDVLLAAITSARGRVLVLTGAGGHFCAGADLQGVEDERFAAPLRRVLVALRDRPVPVIAAVERSALGAGTQLAIASDLRVATPDARFGVPAGKLGLMVDQWTIRRLAAIVGQGPSAAVLLAAEQLTAEHALALGLVQRIGTLDDALAWADEIAALAPLTLAGHKLGLRLVELEAETDPAYAEAFTRAWSSADLQEGIAAFRERRTPTFDGR